MHELVEYSCGPRKGLQTEGKKMKKTFKVKGHELTRKSENKIFTHAVLFRNLSPNDDGKPGATFHVSLKLAQTEMNRQAKISWLQPLEIVEVEEIGKVAF